MSLLHALGINQFAIVQFAIFVLIFAFLTTYVFKPYVLALDERQKRTKGGEALAEEYQGKTVDLQSQYEQQARQINSQIHEIFQKNRSEALAEFDRIVGGARKEATDIVEKNRQTIQRAVAGATAELKGQTTQVALAITNKLLSK